MEHTRLYDRILDLRYAVKASCTSFFLVLAAMFYLLAWVTHDAVMLCSGIFVDTLVTMLVILVLTDDIGHRRPGETIRALAARRKAELRLLDEMIEADTGGSLHHHIVLHCSHRLLLWTRQESLIGKPIWCSQHHRTGPAVLTTITDVGGHATDFPDFSQIL